MCVCVCVGDGRTFSSTLLGSSLFRCHRDDGVGPRGRARSLARGDLVLVAFLQLGFLGSPSARGRSHSATLTSSRAQYRTYIGPSYRRWRPRRRSRRRLSWTASACSASRRRGCTLLDREGPGVLLAGSLSPRVARSHVHVRRRGRPGSATCARGGQVGTRQSGAGWAEVRSAVPV